MPSKFLAMFEEWGNEYSEDHIWRRKRGEIAEGEGK